MPDDQKSDETLVDTYKKGDSTALDILLRRYEAVLRIFLRGFTWLKDIDDIIQEIFITVFKEIKGGGFKSEGEGSFKAWLFRIAKNRCFNINKNQAKQPKPIDKQYLESFPGDLSEIRYYDEADKPTELEKLSDELTGVLGQFSDKERLLLQLVNQDDMTYEKIINYKDINGWQPFKNDKIPNLRRKVCDLRKFVYKEVLKWQKNPNQ